MKWLVHLYPARWRERYEAEFLAFLDEEGHLSIAHRFDVLRGLLDAHSTAWREHLRKTMGVRRGVARQLAGVGTLFTTTENGGILMRRQPLAVLFLLAGLAVGLMAPYARQLVAARASAPPPGYTGLIYQNADLSPVHNEGLTTIDLVNTGRPIPRLVLVLPSKSDAEFEVQRDHKVILVHRFMHLGHGMVGDSLCPLAPGQTATLYLWWKHTKTAHRLDQPLYALYGRVTHLVNIGGSGRRIWGDPQAAVRDIRSVQT
jgi:hypothetical protein